MRLADNHVLSSAQRCRDGFLQNHVLVEENQTKAFAAATNMIVDNRYHVSAQYMGHTYYIYFIYLLY